MAKIPMIKCSGCGKYNDISVTKCECGKELTYFFQKCPGCGTMNFTLEDEAPVKVCYKCMKTRISSVARALYAEEAPKESEEAQVVDPIITGQGAGSKAADAEDEEDDDDAPMGWGKLTASVKSRGAADADNGEAQKGAAGSAVAAGGQASIAGGQASITLTAINYGTFSHTVTSDETPFLLGRSANFREFLRLDMRTGNEHCILTYENEKWHVKDNHSQNGTFLNDRDLGYNGESVLSDGDRLKLGHEGDSLTFRVTLN